MIGAWYLVVAASFGAYAVLDGFDLGAGVLHRRLARTDAERRQILRAVGPLWDGAEVWLLAGAGSLFTAFPAVAATAFSGFYLPTMFVLWALTLRALGVELRAHGEGPVWGAVWDASFALGSGALCFLFGAMAGNVIRGVPLDVDGWTEIPLFTNFRTRPDVGFFDWFTLACGAFGVVVLAFHGATFLAWKTDGAVADRARAVVRRGAPVVAGAWIAAAAALYAARSDVFLAGASRVAGVVALAVAAAGLYGARRWSSRGNDRAAFLASCAFVGALWLSIAAALWPALLMGVTGALEAHAVAAPIGTLRFALGWFAFGLPMVAAGLAYVFRYHRGRTRVEG
ncbi:MAG TPA: cytochrome d ubiquinol oxidase subunit II [Planctomycetota bacterium]|nr:cytochrome d ubiquinol oxidase subunit II [Planctomycetota bacterium]